MHAPRGTGFSRHHVIERYKRELGCFRQPVVIMHALLRCRQSRVKIASARGCSQLQSGSSIRHQSAD